MTNDLNCVNEIIQKLNLDSDRFHQTDVIESVNNPFGNVWTTVYQIRESLYDAPAIFSCLADTKLEHEILKGTDWLRHPGDFSPGFRETRDGTYYENGRDDGYDFLVKEIYFHSLENQQLYINQEFVFLFELFRENDGYYSVDEYGRKEKVVDIEENAVRFKTSFLIRYIAAKQMLFVQFIDSRRSSTSNYPMGAKPIASDCHENGSQHYEIWYGGTQESDYLFSMLYARSIVRPDNVERCRICPYDKETDTYYPEFTIEELPNGSLKRFSCDPSKLQNYFGANQNVPHYLTPIYFSPDVLDRYRNNPNFSVTERRLSCGTQWSIAIDNAIPDRVMVYLGDLGRDLPPSEKKHFLAHEISPTERQTSATAFAQDFLGSFDAPMGPITALFNARHNLDSTWIARFGYSLYRAPHADEEDMEKLIRIPMGNGRQEFDTVILNLTKYCIDYIDESSLSAAKTTAGGINKLDEALRRQGVEVTLKPLRDLQTIRSSCMAHAKGKNYEKIKGSLLTGDCPKDVTQIINRLTDMMNSLTTALREKMDKQ